MAVTPGSIPVTDTGKDLDTTVVTTTEGAVHREVVAIGHPEFPTRFAMPNADGQLAVYVGTVLAGNSSTAALNAAATFTGTGADVSAYPAVSAAVLTDQDGTLYMEFSPDNTNWDSSLSFSVSAGVNEVKPLVVTRQYFRVRFTNTSGSNQTYFRLQSLAGQQAQLTSPLSSTVQRDAGALIVRPMDFSMTAAEGLLQNVAITLKDGINEAISSGTVPEDITNEGGTYAGFPTGTPEEGQIVLASNDAGTVYYSYLASSSSTDYVFGSKAVTTAGNYDLGHDIYRCNFAYFVGSSGAINTGAITIRHKTTTANVFCVIAANAGQTYCAAYTVPAGSSIYLGQLIGNMRGSTTGSMDGYFWYRPLGESPRLRFPFELQYGSPFYDDVRYLIKIPQQVDIIPRIAAASTNGLVAKISYRFLKVKT